MGVAVFFYFRVIRPLKRITLHWEGLLILGILATMMLTDMMYDGAGMSLAARYGGDFCQTSAEVESNGLCKQILTVTAPFGHSAHADWTPFVPGGSFFAKLFKHTSPGVLVVLAHIGFWTHSTLVLVLLNLLPHSKHFHILTGIQNIFLKDLNPPGRLRPMAENAEKLMEVVGKAAESEDPVSLPVGAGRIEHFTWKAILDFYTCTECGRCSDNCPAHRTGKMLSPKQFTLDLRDHLYSRQDEIINHKKPAPAPIAAQASADGATPETAANDANASATPAAGATGGALGALEDMVASGLKPIDLVSNVIHPDVLWGCTTCRACEEQCPVMISYVDKIVDMRRNLVLVKGEFPAQLQGPFQAMET
ncbi:MAG: (Fe-S)-binding protein, partial [Polyangiaceae bacterium]|nr:(Fe-S)-binding protein [Polyangiaceae bacterium]